MTDVSTLAVAPVVTSFAEVSTPVSEYAKKLAAGANKAAKGNGIRDFADSRSDLLRVNPYNLHTVEGLNSRFYDSAENLQHIDELAISISAHGVQEPLTAYFENGKLWLTDGHCRLLATFRAIEVYGAQIQNVPVKTEQKYANEADRLASQILRNSGKPFSVLERGVTYKKLLNLGWSTDQIAAAAGYTVNRVTQILALSAAPAEIQTLVRDGKVSATQATTTLREASTEAEAVQTLKDAVKAAEAIGKTKATKKHVTATETGAPAKVKTAWTPKAALKEVKEAFVSSKTVEAEDEVTVTWDSATYAKVKEFLGL